MKSKIENKFLANYAFMFLISIMVSVFTYLLLSFAGDVLSKTLVKNNYTAEDLMRDDYREIESSQVIANGGGVQVINSDYQVVYSTGINTISQVRLSPAEFTDFLIKSNSVAVPFSYDIVYIPTQEFWLVVTFPTSLRIDLASEE